MTTSTLNLDNVYQELFNKALNEAGELGNYYSYFHNYSFGNMLYLFYQGVSSPVATFKNWAKVNRTVKKGSKAKKIWIPNSFRGEREDIEGNSVEFSFTKFFVRSCMFELKDTSGDEFYSPNVPLPGFNKDKLLNALGIKETSFSQLESLNCQGYSRPSVMRVAINPIAQYPVKTLLHEIAHCLLHAGDDDGVVLDHGIEIPSNIKEVEAESTAFIVGSFLNILSEEAKSSSRGYIQNWLKGHQLSDKTCQRVFGAVNKILKGLKEEVILAEAV